MSDTLIYKLQGNRYVNRTFFAPFLFIYQDSIKYRKRHKIFFVDEVSSSYEHMVRVDLYSGIFFSRLEFVLSGGTNSILIKGIWNKRAKNAKKIVDNKVYHAHHKFDADPERKKLGHGIENFEKSMMRLKELLKRGKIDKKEFEKHKKDLLKQLR